MMHRRFSNVEEILRRLVLNLIIALIASRDVANRLYNFSKPNKFNDGLYMHKG